MIRSKLSDLRLDCLTVRYNGTDVVSDVSLNLTAGPLVGIIGPNGAGKTTLMRAVAGLVRIESGEVYMGGEPVSKLTSTLRAVSLGYLAQDRSVIWPLTVERLVALGRLPHLGPWDAPDIVDAEIVERALADANVAHIARRAVTTLSGGELTRVLIARLLAGKPSILLADEPVSGLDPAHRLRVLQTFRSLAQAGRTVIVSMHDLTLAARFCDRLVLMAEGRIAADGSPRQVLTPEILSRFYGVSARISEHNNELMVLPWDLARN
ncbi:MAG: ABC transporter [Candidatus Marinimicrobia bacterium]|nr:ABC transporter [Candidatus Neomarinimicrobiota bacterium]